MMPLSEFLDQGRLRSSVHEDVLTTVSGGQLVYLFDIGAEAFTLAVKTWDGMYWELTPDEQGMLGGGLWWTFDRHGYVSGPYLTREEAQEGLRRLENLAPEAWLGAVQGWCEQKPLDFNPFEHNQQIRTKF
ncbi:MAG: hypothetical protein N3A60_00155 [Thermanaerothrix sp.]|nr:hypothetical protein [Thermanaerothrix sp.]